MKKLMLIVIGLLLSFQMLQASVEKTVTLNAGYNAVQFDANITLEDLVEKIGFENLISIQGAGQGSTYKKQYVDDNLGFLNSFTQTEAGKAFWFNVTNAATFTYMADSFVDNKEIGLGAGWSFIGAMLPLTLEEIKAQLGSDNLLVIQGAGQGSTYKKEYIDNGTPFLNSFTKFIVGQGYWIKIEGDSSLEFIFNLEIIAKDNSNHNAETIKSFDGKDYTIRVYSDRKPTTETSQDTISIYGEINGEMINISINDSYPSNSRFQIKVFDVEGNKMIEGSIVDLSTVPMLFPSLEFEVREMLSLEKRIFLPNENITIALRGLPANNGDWVGIYPKGSTNDWENVLVWSYTNGTKSIDTEGIEEGTLILEGLPVGEYDLRLFFNNSYDTEVSIVFTVASFDRVYGEGGTHPVAYHDEVDGNMTRVYYPTDIAEGETVPVVFFTSGYNSADATDYETLLRFVASHGYYVIYAKHAWNNVFTNMDKMLDNANGILPKIDITRIGVMGHSLGGGYTFNILKHFSDQGYGDNGRFVMVLEGYYAYNLNKFEMQNLPSNTNVIIQQYGVGGNNNANNTDPRITLTEFYMLDSIADNKKDWQIVENADHGYPQGNNDYSQMQGILKPLDALMEYTFNDTHLAHDVALEQGSDDPYNYGQGIQVVNPTSTYTYKCNSDTNVAIDYCNMEQWYDTYPNTTTLQSRDTDNTVLKPTIGSPTIDTLFQTRIRMVDKSDEGIASYPKVQNWNSDMTLIRIGSRLYDANTLKETDITKNLTLSEAYSRLCSRNSDYFRWSNKDANTFFVINSSRQFIEGKITGNTVNCSSVLDTFSEYEVVHIGPHEGNIDYDDKYVVFVTKKPNDITLYVVLYDIQNKTKVWTKTMPLQQWEWVTVNGSSFWKPSTLDWLSVSPSGKYIVFNNDNGYTDGMYRYDINFENKVKLQYMWSGDGQLYSEGGHGDMGYDTEGNEVFVQFISGLGVYSFNLDNPTQLGIELLHSPYGGGHIGCRNTRRPGWCYITTVGDNYKQVFALKLDGTGDEKVQNFSQSHINDGFHDTYGGVSPDGTKVIFNSHWGTNEVQTFVVEAESTP